MQQENEKKCRLALKASRWYLIYGRRYLWIKPGRARSPLGAMLEFEVAQRTPIYIRGEDRPPPTLLSANFIVQSCLRNPGKFALDLRGAWQ